jgi:signal transduction histidine kinase
MKKDKKSEADILKLIRELEVGKIELELQKEELMLARSAAQNAAEKYIELYDFAPSGYFTLSEEGKIIELNLYGSQMLGNERSRLKNSLFGFFVSNDTKPIFNLFLGKVFNSKAKETCEVTLSANVKLPMYVHLTGIVTVNGEHCLLAMIDISERKMLEDNLVKNKELLSGIEKTAKIGGWVFDVGTMTQSWTEETFRIFEIDLTKGEPKVPDGLDFIAPTFRPMAEQAIQRVIDYGEPYDQEWGIITAKGNKRWVHAVAKAYQEHGKTIRISGSFQDITECKIAKSQIRKLNEELEQRVIQRTEQLEAANKELETFSYSVSHDLRAPLRSIHSYTNILLEKYEKNMNEEDKRLFWIIASSATKMGELIDELLNFSKIGRSSLNSELLDMKSMAGSAFAEIANKKENEKINLKIGKLHKAYGDASLIRLVFNNLISNAIKYSSKETFPEIAIGSRLEGDMIIYFVKDNGVGFDMEYVHKLFGVFQRLHSEGEFGGNGVGLASVQRIILKHNGRVWAEGAVGKGATFYFTLLRKPNDKRQKTK